MIKTILFDVDGVLLNGESFLKSMEPEHGISYEMAQDFFRGPFLESTVGKQDLKEIIEPFLHEWKWAGSTDEFLEYWFTKEHSVDEPLVMHVQSIRAAGVPCYLATNQERYRAEYVMERIGFANKFDGIFASHELGVKKPDIAFFENVHKKFPSIEKHEILFWDDTPENIAAAKEYGFHAEHYVGFEDFKQKMEQYA